MKFYLGDDKRLIVEPSWFDCFDHTGKEYVNLPKAKIQLKSKVTNVIESEIRLAIAEVIKEYQAEMADLPLEDIFNEKRKQVRESYDTEQAITDVIERGLNGRQ
ncbi:TPA: hypothetical protein ACT2H1_001081 [Streptococcus suis]